MSVSAQILQSLRRIETWILWIAVDVGAIGLFWSRGLLVTAGLYALFLVMSVAGFVEWKRRLK
jgi:nicotinamide mononucleotide transporter